MDWIKQVADYTEQRGPKPDPEQRYQINKLHNAVGTVWLSKRGDWTKDFDDVAHLTLDEAVAYHRLLLICDVDAPTVERAMTPETMRICYPKLERKFE